MNTKCATCGKPIQAAKDFANPRCARCRSTCTYCGRKEEGNAGDYYHEKACEAKALRVRLKAETNPARQAYLKARLEQAEYVGD